MPDVATKEPETVGALLDQLPQPQSQHVVATLSAVLPAEAPTAEQPATLLGAIVAASCDPRVDVVKLQALMDMQERLEDRQAKRAFIEAYARLSGKLPRVKKNGAIKLGKDKDGIEREVPVAKWEDMDKVIRPLMAAEGFTLSFDSAARAETGGGLVVSGELMHAEGHSRKASMPLPLDSGPGRNNLQAQGSTLSYGRRYVAEMLLNIVREGADDDGKGSENIALISVEQKEKLIEMMRKAEPDAQKLADRTKRLLKFLRIDALDDLPASRFVDVQQILQEQINAVMQDPQP